MGKARDPQGPVYPGSSRPVQSIAADSPAVSGQISVLSHQGPLPVPDQLEAYDRLIPNGADRIMAMAEKQIQHRIDMERMIIASQQKQSARGQAFGLAIGVLGIASGTLLGMFGRELVGGLVAGSTVVTLVSVFVLGRRIQRRQLDSNRYAIARDADAGRCS